MSDTDTLKNVKRLPTRSEVAATDTWDLRGLCESDEQWQVGIEELKSKIEGFSEFKGKLSDGPESLLKCLQFDSEFDRLAERLGTYAFLRSTEDQAEDAAQRMMATYQNVATQASQASSYIRPEILAMEDSQLESYLNSTELAHFRLVLERLIRYKKHTLGEKEEEILAMQAEMAGAANKAFRQLMDADMKFGFVENEAGESIELSNATFSQLLQSPDRTVRKQAFEKYYKEYADHENTLAATLSSSIQKDVYYSRVRGYESSLQRALFPDNVPGSVYDQLISSVHEKLPALYRYYDFRRRKMGLDEIHQYDTYVPILTDVEIERNWDEATELILTALAPLGEDYCNILRQGLTERWCDRYPNQGKQSGAFSCGSYDADPYILMNYQPTVLRDVFTLAHEAGHSMHSYYSSKHQTYEYYDYTIFVAEVASTFNESLVNHYMLQNATSDKERAYLINHEIDDIRATIYRQTMFAEFEKITHEMSEAGEPLTLQAFKDVYRKLLEQYFGPDFSLDEQLSLECLRIPHFYRAFYVYKYATGLSAAIALSQRVLNGGQTELDDYLSFLKGGCSKDPLDLLRDAGVDMESPAPVMTALSYFEDRLEELETLL